MIKLIISVVIRLTLLHVLATISLSYAIAQDQPADFIFPKNVETKRANFVSYTRVAADSYFVSWGNKNFHRSLATQAIGAPSWFPTYIDENDSVIVLQGGCGNPCIYSWILPLDSNKSPLWIENPETYDIEHNLVAYNGEGDVLCWVENFLTQHKTPVYGINCGSAFNGYCIDSISIHNRELYLRQFTKYEFDKPPRKRQHKIIRLHIDF